MAAHETRSARRIIIMQCVARELENVCHPHLLLLLILSTLHDFISHFLLNKLRANQCLSFTRDFPHDNVKEAKFRPQGRADGRAQSPPRELSRKNPRPFDYRKNANSWTNDDAPRERESETRKKLRIKFKWKTLAVAFTSLICRLILTIISCYHSFFHLTECRIRLIETLRIIEAESTCNP